MRRIQTQEKQKFEEEHIKQSREMAAECVVLLKSDGTLPLTKTGKIAAFGSGVRRTIKGGTGSGDVNVRHFVTVEEGLENAGFAITSKSWLDGYDQIMADARTKFIQEIKDRAKEIGASPLIYSMGKVMEEPEYELPLTAEGDTAIYVLARNSGEGADRKNERGDVKLTETEKRDIEILNERYAHFVLVLNVGGMVDLSEIADVKNVLLLGQLGTVTGDVLADLLLGKSYPSGKLTMTWAPVTDYPSTDGFGEMDATCYREGIYVGYRFFDTEGVEPVYAFGYGLGYTTFRIETKNFTADEKQVSVTVAVKNVGNYVGKEVVQVYYCAPQGKLGKAYQELAGFAKTKELKPQEEQELTITFPTIDMASYDTKSAAYKLEAGEYVIRVGSSSRDTEVCGIISLDDEIMTLRVKNICPGDESEYDRDREAACVSEEKISENIPRVVISSEKMELKKVSYSSEPQELAKGESCSWEDVVTGRKRIEEFVAGLSEEELVYLCLGAYEPAANGMSIIGNASFSIAGAAGETTKRLQHLGVDTMTMADGPAGIRLSTAYQVLENKVISKNNSFTGYMDFMEPEEMKAMAALMPKVTTEEKEAPTYYQYCIAIPIGTALAQSWNTEVCRQYGDMVGEEMELFGVNLWLAPAVNIMRSPLCGRNFEYYSEDPFLSGCIGAGVIEGVQKHPGCGTTIKHFVCNNQETNRYASNSVVSERALREIYLKAFEVAIKKCPPYAVMSSYNLVNGEHTCSSKDLLTHVLRDEWKYEGLVMTDWYVTSKDMHQMTNSRKNKYDRASASGCVKAGNALTMPGAESDREDIMNALHSKEEGTLTKSELQIAAGQVLQAILRSRS
ncbi:glycoside hydrolase family 3 protein [Clostridium sp. C105KSO13]|uniref:glycoside hydrolase family 3 protein n=1 Tax=Clostridium sp. C105KSO13 TaxID=1776045 RepID=UPI000740879E|nr:glycoside hydrolase family 3 protein [Clostridium sp. C105KSO13]CUX25140.1 Thermostable beta-glucosidase B [Clostridium sp. C105KSO13]